MTDIPLREISYLIGLLVVFGSVIKTWSLNKKSIQDLEDKVASSKTEHITCSDLQTKRYSELKDCISDVKQHVVQVDGKVKTVDEKLNLLIRMNGNGKKNDL